MGISNILFIKRVSPSEIGKIISLADIMLVHLKNDPLFEITIPGKTQAYMAAGKPIIMAVKGDAANLVDRADAGVLCVPEKPKNLAAVVEMIYKMPKEKLEKLGENGLKFYNDELCLKIGLSKLNNIFESIKHP